MDKHIYLGLTKGVNFGWGVCSKYLKKELSKKVSVTSFEDEEFDKDKIYPGAAFHGFEDFHLHRMHKNLWAEENYGYTFFEQKLVPQTVENAKKYNTVFAGSSWCCEKLNEAGINNTELLIQGIDHSLFYPEENYQKNQDAFVIFSGGKFELRKGQDMVLAAFKKLQDKYKDIILVNCWWNFLDPSTDTMEATNFIKFEHLKDKDWIKKMEHIYKINGLDASRIITLPQVHNSQLRDLYKTTDIGLFPNRCEGGTNLVLMEYMATGKPVIASYNTGHTDILTEENSLLLKRMRTFRKASIRLVEWEEPSLREIVAQIEYAYHNREHIKQLGIQAGEDMKKLTWEKSADVILDKVF